jgi:20S proteasome alpha/beta subunit
VYSAWKANAIGGKNEKAVREYLEKNYAAEMSEVKMSLMNLKEQ